MPCSKPMAICKGSNPIPYNISIIIVLNDNLMKSSSDRRRFESHSRFKLKYDLASINQNLNPWMQETGSNPNTSRGLISFIWCNVLFFLILFFWGGFLFDWFEYFLILFVWAIFRNPYYVWFLICKFVSPLSLIDDISVNFIEERYNYLTWKQIVFQPWFDYMKV